MKLDIKVENLGKLKKGTVKIRPFTVLTGENGTGKSFFTKTLYSYFNVVNQNLLHKEIIKNINMCLNLINIFDENLTGKCRKDIKHIELFKISLAGINTSLSEISDKGVVLYIQSCSSLVKKDIQGLKSFEEYIKNLKRIKKIKSVKAVVDVMQLSLYFLLQSFDKSEEKYTELLEYYLRKELQENFQISSISELISFDEVETKLFTKNGLDIRFNEKDTLGFNLDFNFVNDIFGLSRVVFFESPAYWSVRDALNKSREVEKSGDLTGVSKYFYDLDQTLSTKSSNLPLEIISELVTELKAEVGGEFIFESGRLSFVDNSGRSIDKNLISFGMTSLGMIQALLKNNVISSGSIVFFDEPETNLHPAWQVLLTKVLIQLAEKDVNVVMATHSLDMIKALEVHTKDKNGDFIAINHFTKEGGLFEFDSDDVTENLIKSRNELMNAYEDLFLSELYNPTDE